MRNQEYRLQHWRCSNGEAETDPEQKKEDEWKKQSDV